MDDPVKFILEISCFILVSGQWFWQSSGWNRSGNRIKTRIWSLHKSEFIAKVFMQQQSFFLPSIHSISNGLFGPYKFTFVNIEVRTNNSNTVSYDKGSCHFCRNCYSQCTLHGIQIIILFLQFHDINKLNMLQKFFLTVYFEWFETFI